jgi:sugar lactone lactonase YvrE
VADFTPDDLSREIDRLWARVGSTSVEPSSASGVPATPSTGGMLGAEAAWETVALLKRQQRQSEASWRQTMQARDEAVRVLRARLESAETALASYSARAENEDERMLVETLDAKQKVETAAKALALAEARHAEERKGLAETMQALRERLAAESARARASEQRWESREQQYLLDLKELQGLAARREKDAGAAEKSQRAAEASLAEAKNALEKTLAELLLERRERERAHGEREAALKNVEELRAHVDELSKIWDEERAQWKELWDRERSSWESRRGELAKWEEDLRREREAWHAELQAKEAAHLALTDDLSGKIRATAQNAEKMSELIDSFDRKSAEESTRSAEGVVELALRQRTAAAARRRWAVGLVVAGVLAASAGPAWRAASAWRFIAVSESSAPTANPAALAFDGTLLWVADWGGRLVAVDPSDMRRVVRQAAPAPGGPYHPTAIAAGGGMLWTLDAAQARLLRHSATDPNKIISARPSPGPAPSALAFDGETVWSYDAVDRALTRHGGDDAPAQRYSLPDEVVPNAMAWSAGKLWVHDAKGHRLFVYALEGDKLTRVSAEAMPAGAALGVAPAVGGSPRERQVFVLFGPSGARGQAEVVRYAVHRLNPFAHF